MRKRVIAGVAFVAGAIALTAVMLTSGSSTTQQQGVLVPASVSSPFAWPDCFSVWQQAGIAECQQGWRYDPALGVTCPVNRYAVAQETMDFFQNDPWYLVNVHWAARCSRVIGPSETPNFWFGKPTPTPLTFCWCPLPTRTPVPGWHRIAPTPTFWGTR